MPNDARQAAIEAMAVGGWITHGQATKALDALLAALPGMGLRVVPVEASRTMMPGLHGHRTERHIYRVMIAAAPNVLEAGDV